MNCIVKHNTGDNGRVYMWNFVCDDLSVISYSGHQAITACFERMDNSNYIPKIHTKSYGTSQNYFLEATTSTIPRRKCHMNRVEFIYSSRTGGFFSNYDNANN